MTPEPQTTTMTDPARWVEEHGDVLFRFAIARVRDQETAEELVQETLLAALQARDRFAGKSTVQTWLVSILRNKIVDHIRRRSRDRVRFDPAGDEAFMDARFTKKGHWAEGPAGWSAGALSPAELDEFRAAIDLCSDKLPPALEQVFTLRELEEMDTDSICKVLSITPTNLWTRLHRMRMTLRECLETHWLGLSPKKTTGKKAGC